MRLLSLSPATIIFPSPKPSEPSAPQEKVFPAIISIHFPYMLVQPFIFLKASNTLTYTVVKELAAAKAHLQCHFPPLGGKHRAWVSPAPCLTSAPPSQCPKEMN